MSELEQLKAERDKINTKYPGEPYFTLTERHWYRAALDRAIEGWAQTEDEWARRVEHVEQERDRAQDSLGKAAVRWNTSLTELAQARVDVVKLRAELQEAGKVLQLAYAAGNELARCGISLDADWPIIQDEAYEAVGEYLYPDITKGGVMFFDRLAETVHYEDSNQRGRQ